MKNWLERNLITIALCLIFFTIALSIWLWYTTDQYWVRLYLSAQHGMTEGTSNGKDVNDVFDAVSAYGTVVGGISALLVGIATTLLLISTLKLQWQTLNEQRVQSTLQRIESRFFELVKMHRENSQEVQLKVYQSLKISEPTEVSGSRSFQQLDREFIIVRAQVQKVLSGKRIYDEQNGILTELLAKELMSNSHNSNDGSSHFDIFLIDKETVKVSIDYRTMLNIAYLFFYYGIYTESEIFTMRHPVLGLDASLYSSFEQFKHSVCHSAIKHVLESCLNITDKPTEGSEVDSEQQMQTETSDSQYLVHKLLFSLFREVLYTRVIYAIKCLGRSPDPKEGEVYSHRFQPKNISDNLIPISEGFLFGINELLGKYYRHLFHTVIYIDLINASYPGSLDFKQKKEYIKSLRAQMSDSEQKMLFWNSLSILGADWELKHRTTLDFAFRNRESANPKNYNSKCLITKYDLIANVNTYYSAEDKSDSLPKAFFPLVRFESDAEGIPRKKSELEKYFEDDL